MNSSLVSEAGSLRILHSVPSVGPTSGGLAPVALELAREQVLSGHSAVVWCLDSPMELTTNSDRVSMQGLTIHSFPTVGPSWLGYSPAMERAVASHEGDSFCILHQHSIWMANSRATQRWRQCFTRPTVIAPHGTLEPYALAMHFWKKRLALLAYEAKNLRLASCLHATSQAEARNFRAFGLRGPIAVIPNGVSEQWLVQCGEAKRFRAKFSLSDSTRLLLFLSRVHPKKGLPLLLEAMAGLRDLLSEWCLLIVGPDEERHSEQLRRMATRIGIAQSVRFLGPLYGLDKRDAFAAADLFVLPTHSENFGIAVAEALGAGIPVITTHGAPWEDLRTAKCGWWVEATVAGIREALRDAMGRSRGELVAMGLRGKALVASKYTWPRIARHTIALYQWLLGLAPQPEFVVTD